MPKEKTQTSYLFPGELEWYDRWTKEHGFYSNGNMMANWVYVFHKALFDKIYNDSGKTMTIGDLCRTICDRYPEIKKQFAKHTKHIRRHYLYGK